MKIERKYGSGYRPQYVIHYESLEDLVNDKPKSSMNEKRLRQRVTHGEFRGPNWYGLGANDISEFEAKVNEGWPELLADVKAKAATLGLSPETLPVAITQATRRKRVRTDNGSELDIHAVYQGAIDRAWSNTKREIHNVRRKSAHVYVNIGGLGAESALSSIWRAACAYKVCEMLQKAGYTVEITVGATAQDVYQGIGNVHTSYTAKPSNMPLDLSRLAMQSCLGWHRVYNFRARICNDDDRVVNMNMGYTVQDAVSPYVAECEQRGVLLIPLRAYIHSKEAAQRMLSDVQALIEEHSK